MRTLTIYNEPERMFFNTLETLPEYAKPSLPYNIVKDRNGYIYIELAVAGYAKDNLSVELQKNLLVISGEINKDDSMEYLHKGLTTKQFSTSLPINPMFIIDEVTLKNGLLSIRFKKNEKEVSKYNIKLLS